MRDPRQPPGGPAHPLRGGGARLILLSALLALAAAPAAAQVVYGTARESRNGRPLAGAELLLVDSAGTAVDSTRAAGGGAFRLLAPRAGSYFIHVQLDGWAGVPSDGFVVQPGRDREVDVRVPLIGAAALAHMRSILEDEGMQRPLEEICGEPLRPWEAGILVGTVRDRRTREPVRGAEVRVATAAGEALRATVSNARGSYVLCNLPAATELTVTAEAADGRRDVLRPEIRAGVTAWYDLLVRP